MADKPEIAASKLNTVADFLTEVNTLYKRPILTHGGKSKLVMSVPRFSSGILGLDEALGGGWPLGRVALVAGEFSTGKTELAMQAMKSIQEYDHATKVHKLLMPEGAPFTPGKTLWIDVENAFDYEWAAKKGINIDGHIFARPETSEEVIDIVTLALSQNFFDLVVIDSLAAMIPSEELEASAEDYQMGLAARLNNKAFRKWNSQMCKRSSNMLAGSGPMLLVLNQFRLKIGKAAMFGDPRTTPGGQGQGFCASVLIYTRGSTYDSKDDAVMEAVELGGIVFKNKLATPKQNFAYSLQLKKGANLDAGELDNLQQLTKRGKELKLVVKNTDVGYTFAGRSYRTLEELQQIMKADPNLKIKLWRSIIVAGGGKV